LTVKLFEATVILFPNYAKLFFKRHTLNLYLLRLKNKHSKHHLPMTDSTPVPSSPSPRVLQNLRAFARAYRPKNPELEVANFATEQGEKTVVMLKG